MTNPKSNERIIAALNTVKMMCDHGKEIKFDSICDTFAISPGTFTALKSLGIVVSIGGRKYQWIGKAPSESLCNTLKDWLEQRYRGKRILDKQDESFETMRIMQIIMIKYIKQGLEQ